jgi:hypothetical protein
MVVSHVTPVLMALGYECTEDSGPRLAQLPRVLVAVSGAAAPLEAGGAMLLAPFSLRKNSARSSPWTLPPRRRMVPSADLI